MANRMSHPPNTSSGARIAWAILFLVWLTAGLWGLFIVGRQLFAIDADIYALNGSDQQVTIACAGQVLATLQPDESMLIRRNNASDTLEVNGEQIAERFGPIEAGISILNIGDGYQVSHNWARYSSMPATDFEGEKSHGQQGLYHVSDFVVLPWLVYGFDSSPPGTVTEGNNDSRLDLRAKSPSRRTPVERRHLLNSELMQEFGWAGVLISVAILFTVWCIGLKFLGLAAVKGFHGAVAG